MEDFEKFQQKMQDINEEQEGDEFINPIVDGLEERRHILDAAKKAAGNDLGLENKFKRMIEAYILYFDVPFETLMDKSEILLSPSHKMAEKEAHMKKMLPMILKGKAAEDAALVQARQDVVHVFAAQFGDDAIKRIHEPKNQAFLAEEIAERSVTIRDEIRPHIASFDLAAFAKELKEKYDAVEKEETSSSKDSPATHNID